MWAVLVLGSGCESGPRIQSNPGVNPTTTTTATATATCLDPLQGSRYRMCGGLAAMASDSPSSGRWVTGAVDSSLPNVTGTQYRLQGGSFHAQD
jgi:hypothetical protein